MFDGLVARIGLKIPRAEQARTGSIPVSGTKYQTKSSNLLFDLRGDREPFLSRLCLESLEWGVFWGSASEARIVAIMTESLYSQLIS